MQRSGPGKYSLSPIYVGVPEGWSSRRASKGAGSQNRGVDIVVVAVGLVGITSQYRLATDP
jgi:uncharacterized protein YbdZ (MbtH family)